MGFGECGKGEIGKEPFVVLIVNRFEKSARALIPLVPKRK